MCPSSRLNVLFQLHMFQPVLAESSPHGFNGFGTWKSELLASWFSMSHSARSFQRRRGEAAPVPGPRTQSDPVRDIDSEGDHLLFSS